MDKLVYLLVFIFFFASCSEDDQVDSDTNLGEGVSCEVALSVASMEGDVSFRSTESSMVNDSLISNLWVLQFEDASTGGSGALLKKFYVAVENLTKIDIILKANETDKKSNIYFFANLGKTDLDAFTGNETAFKTAVQKVTSEQGFLLSGGDPEQTKKYIPMSGSLLSKRVTAAGIYGGINVQLVRMLARVDFLYSIGPLAAGKFNLKSVQICNVLNHLMYVPQENPADLRSLDAENMLYLDAEPITAGTIIPGSSPEVRQLTYYVPENCRGNGNNLSGLDKMKSGVPFATHIELYGEGVGSNLGEKYKVKFYPGNDTKNNYDIKRNTRYILNVNLANLSLSDRRITKVGSNCYIVKPGESVNIPISRANESLLDLQIPDVYNSGCTASVYWETGSISGGVVTLSNTNCNGGIFTVNGVGKGNAVVCVKNALGDILWSWHIWVSDVDFKTSNTITTTNTSVTPNAEYVWMDRSLGALDLPGPGKTYATTAGLFYQWGRKDPFLPSATIDPAVLPITTQSISAINESYAKSINPSALRLIWSGETYMRLAVLSGAGPYLYSKALLYSIKSPMLFINGWKGSTATTNSSTGGINSWGGEYGQNKSVYDPCPQGWRLPSGKKSSTAYSSPWFGMAEGFVQNILNGKYYYWNGSTPDFGLHPLMGTRNQNGALLYIDDAVGYWQATLGYIALITSVFVEPDRSVSDITDNANPVRCVKE